MNGMLYVGVTNDIIRRVFERKNKQVEGFTKKHGLTDLVYFERFNTATEAVHREKCIKKWNRAWKLKRIHALNPGWRDLYDEIAK